MKTFNTYYKNKHQLHIFISNHGIQDSDALLIQVFTARNDIFFIQSLINDLTELLPNAHIIGASTDGEIMDGHVSMFETVLSFTQFEHTTLKTDVAIHQATGYYSGQYLARSLIQDNTKLMIAFIDGLHSNGEAFLEGIHSIDQKVIIAGGLAADHAAFDETFVFTKTDILNKGAVAVSLSSDTLFVSNGYNFNWSRVGKALTITHAQDNRVYTINNKSAYETYAYYLGEDMAKELPAIGIEFPLILTRNNTKVARAVLGKYDDGSLTFAGNLNTGDKVQFGYGNPTEILNKTGYLFDQLQEYPSDAIFIYSCMARRRFMPDTIHKEIQPLQSLAPTSGLFTYGEFYTGEKKELLNQTMTVVSLSEKNYINIQKEHYHVKQPKSTSSISSLIHLIQRTAQESMEHEALVQARQTFEKLFEKSPDGIMLLENDIFVQCNQKMLDIFGYVSTENFVKAEPYKLFPKKQPDGTYSLIKLKKMRALARKHGSHQFEWVHLKENGKTFWVDILLTFLDINGKNILYMVYRDITVKKEMEQQLEYQANYDALTNLPNRFYFMKTLEKEIITSTKKQKELAIFFLDLDGFKKINDTLGHEIGDKVIIETAKRLRDTLRKKDIVSRLGGDEFTIMMRIFDSTEIAVTARRIIDVVKQPMYIDQHIIETSTSIGVSISPQDSTTAGKLLQYADTAMYKAKHKNGNNFQFYTSDLTAKLQASLEMEKELRRALKEVSFEIYYQPQMNILTKEIIGVEALVRWNHPTLGKLSPDHFIPLLNKEGLIVEFDLWVMRTAIQEISLWLKEGIEIQNLSLNISMKHLMYPNFIKEISTILDEFDFDETKLELEITETELMINPDIILGVLKTLSVIGIKLSIDDFGTGYSSLSHLKYLPIDKLKIDKSFIKDIHVDTETEIIVKSMITLAKSLELSVIAEGVEHDFQEEFLLSHGCYYAQGYLYSEPLNGALIKNLIKHQHKIL